VGGRGGGLSPYGPPPPARGPESSSSWRAPGERDRDLATVAGELWRWLAAPEHAGLLRLWVEGYGRSLVDPDGPWTGFAGATVTDWLAVLADAQAPEVRASAAGEAERTAVLAVLRGALLDLLATGDVERVTVAVTRAMAPAHLAS
jgi:hypothetical protein